jgi:hypothetical protein
VLETIWVREEEIIDIISILDSNKATGPDKISNNMIISRSIFLCKWLNMFLNTIFSNILLTQDNTETGLQFEGKDLSPFLNKGIT